MNFTKLFRYLDLQMLVAMLFLVAFGVLNIYSATIREGGNLHRAQLLWFSAGMFLLFMFVIIDYRVLEHAAIPFYILNIALLILVWKVGAHGGGARRWLDFGMFRFQPSETMKLCVVFMLAKYFDSDRNSGGYRLRDLWIPFLIVGLPMVLILAQPDLGTALLLGLIAFTIFFFMQLRFKSLLIIFSAACLTIPLAWKFMLKPYQRQRVMIFLDPTQDPRGSGYNAIQSVIAVGSGEFWGRGFRKGVQTQLSFTPEQHTDFIFTVLAEEHGFIGVGAIILAFLIILLRGFRLASNAREKFGVILGVGLIATLAWQAIINMGMVIGLLPIVGVPLPFVSYGGSSMLTSLSALGIVLNIGVRRFFF